MTTTTRRRSQPPSRSPLRAAVGAVIGTVAVAGIVAFAAHQWFYVVLLYSFLMGMTGGLMAWMVLDELRSDLQGSRAMAVAGMVAAAVTYLLFEYLRYVFDTGGMDPRPGWWAHLRETADAGVEVGRVGRTSTIDVGAPFVWALRLLELGIAMVVGAMLAPRVQHRR